MRGRIFLDICIFLSFFTLCTCKAAPEQSAVADNVPAESAATLASQTPVRQTANSAAVYSAQEHQEQAGRIEVAYEILEKGSYGREFAPALIENQADLDRLYALLHGHSSPPAPKIDFTQKKVIAVRAGPFNTGGYGIKLYSAIYTQDGLETVFLITAPAPTQIVTQAFTTPYLIIGIDVPPSTPVSVTLQGYKSGFDFIED
ncbi:dentilisin complex subunit PrcB [Treponema maltophilum]|uniref:dentilisin complex subunit PrcB n=1 Tax=Treponema maltophilum TaxID=51160 RepID=UPI003D9412A2